MEEIREGSFCWVELAADKADVAKDFYRAVFGWEYLDEEMPDAMGIYTTAKAKGLPAAALFSMNKQMREMKIPSHWGSYIRVKNVDETLKRAQELKAEVLQPSFDVMDAGRMATIKDPANAVVHLWQKNKAAGAALQNHTHGAFSWNELMTNDLEKSKAFYCELFDWQCQENDWDGNVYVSLKHQDGYPVGGMMKIEKDMGEIPPHWAIYFTVDSITDAVEKTKANGGQIYFGPHEVKGMGQFAVCQDAQGAAFSIIEFQK